MCEAYSEAVPNSALPRKSVRLVFLSTNPSRGSNPIAAAFRGPSQRRPLVSRLVPREPTALPDQVIRTDASDSDRQPLPYRAKTISTPGKAVCSLWIP